MTQDTYGRTLTLTDNGDGTVTYTCTNPDGTDGGISNTVHADKTIEAVLTTFNGLAPQWWVDQQPKGDLQ